MRTQGGGGRGNAAQHSQSLEMWYVHMPGLIVVQPSTPYDAKGLLKSAIRNDNPVIFIEHKLLYNTTGPVPEEEYLIPLGVADVKRPGKDVTIVATSRMVLFALEAAEKLAAEGIDAEVIDPRTLKPLDLDDHRQVGGEDRAAGGRQRGRADRRLHRGGRPRACSARRSTGWMRRSCRWRPRMCRCPTTAVSNWKPSRPSRTSSTPRTKRCTGPHKSQERSVVLPFRCLLLRSFSRWNEPHEQMGVIRNTRIMKYNHLGIPTSGPFEGEINLPHLKMTVSDHENNPFGIQWQRYWEDVPLPLTWSRRSLTLHLRSVTWLPRKGQKVIIKPNSPSEGLTVAFIEVNGAPIELMEYARNWPKNAAG